MAGHIIHELPNGSGVVETTVGLDLRGVTLFPDMDAAWEAVTAHASGAQPSADLIAVEEVARAQRTERNPYKRFEDMSYPRLFWEAMKSIRIGRPA